MSRRSLFSKHQFATTPSKGFVWARVRKYMGQRATFTVKSGIWLSMLLKEGFNKDEEVKANGIFWGLYKKDFGKFELIFRGLVFIQGDKTALPCLKGREGSNKFIQWRFQAEDIGLDAANQLGAFRGLLTGGNT